MIRKTAIAAVALLGTFAASSSVSAHEDQSSVSASRDAATQPAPHGFKDVLPTADGMVGAALQFMAVEDGDLVRVVCIDFENDFLADVEYHADGSDALKAITSDDLAAVRWLASHMTFNADGSASSTGFIGTPIAAGTDGLTEQFLPYAEGAAAQLAVWKHTQGIDISGVANPAIVTRANDIASFLADPANRNYNEGAHDFSVTASANVTAEGVGTVDVSLAGQYALELLPVAGVDVTITAPGVDLDLATEGVQDSVVVTSNENGVASVSGIEGLTADTTVSASASFALLPGTVFSHENGQQVATLNVASVTRTATAVPTVEVAPEVVETTVPETTVPETTVPETTVPAPAPSVPAEAPEDGLPKTGNELTLALLAVGLGAGIFGFRMRQGNAS